LSDIQKTELYCCGKYLITKSGNFGKYIISKDMVDLFWSWVWDTKISGNHPQISNNFPMLMDKNTGIFRISNKASNFKWWISISCSDSGNRIKIPLSFNPYLNDTVSFANSIMVMKRNGKWSFELYDKSLNKPNGSQGKVGIDIGLNVIATTSDGKIYGKEFKNKFDYEYRLVQKVRSNRQRQGLKENSKRLSRLESKLSGMTKTITGTIANKLIKSFPGHTFVMEDLDLVGCKGQKRFAYRALYNSINNKACVESVNQAYSSQLCPSCGYVDKNNRNGIKFKCKNCGRISHADVIGGINLLRRSGDKQINSANHPSVVKTILRERYLRKRNSSLDRKPAPLSDGQKLTTKVSFKEEIGIASNQVANTS
jgi:putative transposase